MSGITIIAPNADLSLLRVASQRQSPIDVGSSIITSIAKNDPESAKELERKQAEAKSIIEQLNSTKKDIKEQRKADAAEKVARLKAEIMALRFLAASDPKAAARKAARLARELAAAAKDYASAGAGGGANVVQAGADVSAGDANVVNATAGAETVTNQVTSAAQTPQTVAPDGNNNGAEEGGNDPTQEDADIKLSVEGAVRAAIDEAAKKQGEKEADDNFSNEVRTLMSMLKSILSAAKKKLQSEKSEASTANDIQKAEAALQDTQKSVNDISAPTFQAAPVSTVNIIA